MAWKNGGSGLGRPFPNAWAGRKDDGLEPAGGWLGLWPARGSGEEEEGEGGVHEPEDEEVEGVGAQVEGADAFGAGHEGGAAEGGLGGLVDGVGEADEAVGVFAEGGELGAVAGEFGDFAVGVALDEVGEAVFAELGEEGGVDFVAAALEGLALGLEVAGDLAQEGFEVVESVAVGGTEAGGGGGGAGGAGEIGFEGLEFAYEEGLEFVASGDRKSVV